MGGESGRESRRGRSGGEKSKDRGTERERGGNRNKTKDKGAEREFERDR